MGGGREAAVTEQELNGAHVGAGFQQMDGEGVPQTVGRDRFGQAGAVARFRAGVSHGIPGDRLVGMIAGEEPRLWPARLPIVTQDLQQLGRQHHVAVLLAFALLDANDHSLAVDARGLQPNRFRDAQAGGIASGQDGVVFDVEDATEEPLNLLGTEDDRQLLRLLGKRQDLFRRPVPSSVTL